MNRSKRLFTLCIAIAFVMALFGPVWAEEVEKVNINTATVEELTQLKKIGPKYAAKIVEYREANGPFAQPEDIIKIKGIGPKTLEANQDRIVVE